MKDTSVAAFRRQTISESCLNGQRLALIGFVLFVYHHYYHHHDRQWTLVSFRFLSLSLSLCRFCTIEIKIWSLKHWAICITPRLHSTPNTLPKQIHECANGKWLILNLILIGTWLCTVHKCWHKTQIDVDTLFDQMWQDQSAKHSFWPSNKPLKMCGHVERPLLRA